MSDTRPVAGMRGRAYRLVRAGLGALTASVVAGLLAVRAARNANERYLFSGEGIEYIGIVAVVGLAGLLVIAGLALVLLNRRTAQQPPVVVAVGSVLALLTTAAVAVAANMAADRIYCPAEKPACEAYYEPEQVQNDL